MPSIPYCDNGTAYSAGFDVDVNPSLPGSPIQAQPLSACNYQQTAGGKRRTSRKLRKKTKKKKAGAAVVGSLVAAYSVYGIYMAAYGLVSAYNTFVKPKGEKPLTVTQATIDYVKMKGTDVLNNLRGMDRSQQKVVFKDYEAYIKTHPKESRMVIRRVPKKKDEEFKITSDEEDDYRVARDMAKSKKRSRKKRSRKKRSRKKRSRRAGAALPPDIAAKLIAHRNDNAEFALPPNYPKSLLTKSPAKKPPTRPPPKPPSKRAPKVPARSAPKTSKKTSKKTSPKVPARPSSGTVLPGMTPGGGFGGGPSWKGNLEPSGSDLERNSKSFGV